MTNKTERWFVMSEAEFEAALYLRSELSVAPGYVAPKMRAIYDKAEAACRAREVHLKSIFRNGVGEQAVTWEEIKK